MVRVDTGTHLGNTQAPIRTQHKTYIDQGTVSSTFRGTDDEILYHMESVI